MGNGSPWAPTHLASLGSKYALIPPRGSQGLVGTLSATTNAGVTYLLSAKIATADVVNAPTFELRLRNSASGAESAPVVQGLLSLTSNWALITGTVPASAGFDRVVLRYQASMVSGADWGLADDVQVCQAALASTGHPPGWWTVARVVGALVLGSILTGVLVVGGVVLRTRRRRHL